MEFVDMAFWMVDLDYCQERLLFLGDMEFQGLDWIEEVSNFSLDQTSKTVFTYVYIQQGKPV